MHEAQKDETLINYYVCNNCFSRIADCNCICFPSGQLIYIDLNIQEHVKILNLKGYKTTVSCEGHKPDDVTYILFSRYDGIGNIEPPEGFTGREFGTGIEHRYSKELSMEEFKTEKQKYLNILLEWAKALPERKNGKR